MKKKIYILLMTMISSSLIMSCLNEDNVSNPIVRDVTMFMVDVNGNDSLVTTVKKGREVKIVVSASADIVSVWPGGIRQTMKMKNSSVDSIDMFGHPMLVVSDSFEDYGLVKARGLNSTLSEDGWYVFYTYPDVGEFDLTIVCTNHGYDGPDLRRVIHNAGAVRIEN